jgi:hypothetical protein
LHKCHLTNNSQYQVKNLDQGKGLSGRKLKKKFSPPALDPTWNNIMKREITNATAQTQKKRDRRRKGRLFS